MATDTAKLDIQTTVMAIREELMSYYKGGCVQKLTTDSPVYMKDIYGRDRYQYERQEHQKVQPRLLVLNEVPIVTLRKSPDRALLHVGVLNRSPQLRIVRKELEKFFDRYLIGVDVSYNEKGVNYA